MICTGCAQDVQAVLNLKDRNRDVHERREKLIHRNKIRFMFQLGLVPTVQDDRKLRKSKRQKAIEVVEDQPKLKRERDPASKKPKPKQSFICSVCSKQLSTDKGLTDHIENIHNKSIRFSCDYCGKGYWHKSVFVQHVKGHTAPARGLPSKVGRKLKLKIRLVRPRKDSLNKKASGGSSTRRPMVSKTVS